MVSFANAGITISEPLEVYSLGDKLYVTVDGIRGSEFGNLNIDLVCSNNSIRLAQLPARAFDTKEDQSWSIPYKILDKTDLEISNLSSIVGNCQIISSIPGQSASTKKFRISNLVNVNAKLERNNYNPGDQIKLFVEATNENGKPLNGFIQVSNATQLSKSIQEGNAIEVFSMPKTSEAGNYLLTVRAYDLSGQEILNEGITTLYFEINAIPSSLVLSISTENIVPGEKFSIGTEVYDQSGKEIEGKTSIKLISPNYEETIATVEAGDFSEFKLEENATVGNWRVISSFNQLITEREITVIENQKASFEMEDSILIIKNIGNVKYNKTINVNIGEEVTPLVLNIGIGETRKFNLQAPNGEYEVSISDGENSISNSVLLTGKAISVSDIDSKIFKDYLFVWIFLILVLGITGVIFVRKYRKTKNVEEENNSKISKFIVKLKEKFNFSKKEKIPSLRDYPTKTKSEESFDPKKYISEDKNVVDMTKRTGFSRAESSLVLKGEKEMSAVVSIKIKNISQLKEDTKQKIVKILNEANTLKGLIDWKNEYAFIIFSPLVTRTFGNESLAVRTSMKIIPNLKDHNKRFKDKIEFNIGIHSGELIATRSGSSLKYTSLGNTISFAKRLSDISDSKVIISDEVHKKMLRDLKVSKISSIGERGVYEILDVKNREANEAKLKELLKRM